MSLPLVSIITPCLNRVNFVREALESVLVQNYPNFEHIIIDGGSTDGTLDVVRSYPHLSVMSEQDSGMYDAINKGVRIARGEIFAWLNTDDVFCEGTFWEVVEDFKHFPNAFAVSAGVAYFKGDPKNPQIYQRYSAVTTDDFWSRIVDTPATNGWFFKPVFFDLVGYFNSAYRFVADRELFIRAALKDVVPTPCQKTVYLYRQHDASYTVSAQDSRIPVRGIQRMRVLTEDLTMLESFLKESFHNVRRIQIQARMLNVAETFIS